MSARILSALLVAALTLAPAGAKTLPPVQIVTPLYTLNCSASAHAGKMILECTPKRTPRAVAHNAFQDWRYGDPAPKALLAQVVGNGGPAVCDGVNIGCGNGVVTLNTGGTLAASSTLCTNSSSLITTTGCTGGDTITSPNSSLSIGGTSTATTLDIALGHSNNFSVQQNFVGTVGATGCSGTNFPTGVYGPCVGGGDGTSNTGGIVIGSEGCDFNTSSCASTSDSAHIRWYDSLASSTVLNACDQWIDTGFAGKPMYFSCNTRISGDFTAASHIIEGGAACSGSGSFTGQTSSGSSGCLVTMASGTATWTFKTAWTTAPLCIGQNETNTDPVKITTTATAATITAGTTTDVVAVFCFGNGTV